MVAARFNGSRIEQTSSLSPEMYHRPKTLQVKSARFFMLLRVGNPISDVVLRNSGSRGTR